jgi:hypothetical protein
VTQHGTNSKYQLGCRCDRCRTAHRVESRNRRGYKPRTITHGKPYAYRKGCRCEICIAARLAENERQLDRYYAAKPKPLPVNPERFERICRYSEKLSIPLAEATRLVDRMGL